MSYELAKNFIYNANQGTQAMRLPTCTVESLRANLEREITELQVSLAEKEELLSLLNTNPEVERILTLLSH